MNYFRALYPIIIAVILSNEIISQSDYKEKITYTFLNKHLIIVSGTQFNINQAAVKSDSGIIIIDSGISPDYAVKIRDSLMVLFNDSRFIYVINTHHHWDHSQGNQVFNGAKLIGHAGIVDDLKQQADTRSNSAQRSLRETNRNYPDSIPPPPPSHILIEGQSDFTLRIPDILFKDFLVIKAGELTVNLFYYGEGHTDNDILVYIPETKMLAVGDLFYKKSLPSFGSRKKMDIERWLAVLDLVLKEQNNIEYVIPGHNELFTINELAEYRDYINTLVEEIKSSISQKEPFTSLASRLKLDKYFPDLSKKDLTSNDGSSLHYGNILKLWEYLQE